MPTSVFATSSGPTELLAEIVREFFLGPVLLFRSRRVPGGTVAQSHVTSAALKEEELPSIRTVVSELSTYVLMIAIGTLQFLLLLAPVLLLQHLPEWLPELAGSPLVQIPVQLATVVLGLNLVLFVLYVVRATFRIIENLVSPSVTRRVTSS